MLVSLTNPTTMQTLFSLLLILLFVTPLAQSKPSSDEPSGGYEPLNDLLNIHVRQIGDFAVSEHNSDAGTHLKFLDIFMGYYQIVEGKNYDLTLVAINGEKLQYCKALVYENLEKGLSLTSFEENPTPIGGYEMTKPSKVVELAKRAVGTYNRDGGQPLLSFRELNVALHSPSTRTYLLYITVYPDEAGSHGIPLLYRAKVFSDSLSFPTLMSFDQIPLITKNYIPTSPNRFISMVIKDALLM